MSRITFEDELGRERVVVMDYEECRYKTNGKCYNNREMKRLGKVCRGCESGKSGDSREIKSRDRVRRQEHTREVQYSRSDEVVNDKAIRGIGI